MKEKITIRYVEFTSARNGNRILHFLVTTSERADAPSSVEIPIELLVGADRIPFQDCAGISYAKLQRLVGVDSSEVPRLVRLTASDILEFKQQSPHVFRGRPAAAQSRRME